MVLQKPSKSSCENCPDNTDEKTKRLLSVDQRIHKVLRANKRQFRKAVMSEPFIILKVKDIDDKNTHKNIKDKDEKKKNNKNKHKKNKDKKKIQNTK